LFTKALKVAFPRTLPVMAGMLFMGFTFGLLMRHEGWGSPIALLMSVFIYAGSMQFVTIGFLSSVHGLAEIALMTLLINARHMFYGLAVIGKYKGAGRKKPYMIYTLTDETFSLVCSANVPEGVAAAWLYFCIGMLNQIYWVAGTAAGAAAGAMLSGVGIKGLEFTMTALFVSIFVDQWRAAPTRIPALMGLGASFAALLLFGKDYFILPAMAAIVALLFALRKPVESKFAAKGFMEAAKCQPQDMR
jgi:4-azaleucine resistance transporter AzlC